MSRRNHPKNKINEQFIPMHYSLIKSELFEYLTGDDLKVYLLVASKKNGDHKHDEKLAVTTQEAITHISSATFSKCKLRLWAFRLIEVTHWGRSDMRPTRFKISLRWKTLIRMPHYLKRINNLLERHDKIIRFCTNAENNKRTPQEIKEKKRELRMEIKKKIMSIPVGKREVW